jgi:hypothetical protein
MHILLKPVVVALAATPLVGAAVHSNKGPRQRVGVDTLCYMDGGAAKVPQPSELMTLVAMIETSATYGERVSRSLFCRPRYPR